MVATADRSEVATTVVGGYARGITSTAARSTMRAWHPGHTLTLAVIKGVPQFPQRHGFDFARPIR
jgi:hypothetical protein